MKSTRLTRFAVLVTAAVVAAVTIGLAGTAGVFGAASPSSAKVAVPTGHVQTGYSNDGERANVAFARADARQLLNLVAVPAGAVVLHHRPAGANGCLSGLGRQPAGNEVAYRWWVTSLAPQTVIDDLDSNSPRGGVPNEVGSGSCPRAGDWYNVEIDWPSIANKVFSRAVYVTATTLNDGKTGVLVESESDAMPLRSASDRVPAGVTRVQITTTQPSPDDIGAIKPLDGSDSPESDIVGSGTTTFSTQTATVVKAATIKQIVNLANALQSTAGWAMASCTLELASRAKSVTIDFYGRGGQRLALLEYTDYGSWDASAPNGCQPVTLEIGERWVAPLLDVNFVSRLRKLVPARLF